MARRCDRIICMMPQSSDTNAALFGENGVEPALRPGMLILDMSTGSPTATKEMYARLRKQGVSFMDAPSAAGWARRKTGLSALWRRGDRKTYDAVQDLFGCMGEEIFYVGASGTGHTIKLINNMLTGINLAGISEGMVMGVKAGLDPELCSGSSIPVPGRVIPPG